MWFGAGEGGGVAHPAPIGFFHEVIHDSTDATTCDRLIEFNSTSLFMLSEKRK